MTTTQLRFGESLDSIVLREKKKTDPRIRPLVEAFYKHKGYHCLTWAAEGAHAKVMLRAGYTLEQVIACHDWLKLDPFWKDKDIKLGAIRSCIAPWVAAGSPDKRADGAVRETPKQALRRESRRYYDGWAAKRAAREANGH